ncbi:MltA domain-containing protein [Hyphomicrobium sp.]|uniref:murein transglycosylase A n=1 Tax=Hyphomicrobium sp. TaxID=82 RepID=UPI002CEE37F0|nr:MltA domain-containing protein [Hyphomicrobium sp.]HRN88120.1 MltA domain-containing protein [Hyphomicrobium sp.]HRQ28211.1 MltA domain-containing protein [Hyphomicrobium sp.]
MPLGAPTSEPVSLAAAFSPVPFAELPGWRDEDHLAAFQAFVRSAPALRDAAARASGKTKAAGAALVAAADLALSKLADIATRDAARAFFEQAFVPHRVEHKSTPGLLTGYYEPVLDAARQAGGAFRVPVYRRPPDLVNLVGEAERGALAEAPTHARKTASGVEPYATRAEIEEGALAGQGLELIWLEDPVDAFFLHVQGSGRVRFSDGQSVRITYDGKNGHPYTSIGRYLIDNGAMSAEEMSLGALKVWLTAHPDEARSVMQQNKSFVFFRALGSEADAPLGALGTGLSDGRSLAVDTGYHALGTPIYVSAPTLKPGGERSFERLMIAQDVGSAIRGPERGDIYFGSGEDAGRLAGSTKHTGRFFVLLPRDA